MSTVSKVVSRRATGTCFPPSRRAVLWGVSLFAAAFTMVAALASHAKPEAYFRTELSTTPSSCGLADLTRGSWQVSTAADGPALVQKAFCQVDKRQDCATGLVDSESDKLVWRPDREACRLRTFDTPKILGCLKHKHIVFFGDSLARNTQQSLQCMAMEAAETPQPFTDGYKLEYNTVLPSRNASIRLLTSRLLASADIAAIPHDTTHLVVSTGSWWGPVAMGFSKDAILGPEAPTPVWWAWDWVFPGGNAEARQWVDRRVQGIVKELLRVIPQHTTIIWRTPDTTHVSAGRGEVTGCAPMSADEIASESPAYHPVVRWLHYSVLRHTAGTRIHVMDVLEMTAARPDAHPSGHIGWIELADKRIPVGDCMHWCLTGVGRSGVPDTWNQVLLNYLC